MISTTMGIISSVSESGLLVNYECQTDRVSFSIADIDGQILLRGNCEDIENNTIDIRDLPKGMYMICIIDGAELTKARFNKS